MRTPLLLCAALFLTGAAPCSLSAADAVVAVRDAIHPGGRVDWSADGAWIAYDQAGADGFYDVWVMRPDGSDRHALTVDHPGLPNRHQGQPAWHPSGTWLAFQAEKRGLHNSATATPGIGVRNDLWAITADGRQVKRLREVPDDADHGVLHPHISPDGARIAWSEMHARAGILPIGRAMGSWSLMTADLVGGPGLPRLANIVERQPGDDVFYECHGFTADGQGLIYTSNRSRWTNPLTGNAICVLDLATGRERVLADGGYNEHAAVAPDGRISWMSSRGNPNRGTDWWIMDADGRNPARLTSFNDPSSAQWTGGRLIAADHAWAPDGRSFIGYVQTDLGSQEGYDVIVDLITVRNRAQ